MSKVTRIVICTITLLCGIWVAAPPASAGVYFVRACDPVVGLTNIGGWQRWPPVPNPGAAGTWGNGLVSNKCTATGAGLEIYVQAGRYVPFGATGNWMFEAPEGASVVGFSASVRRSGVTTDPMQPEFWVPGTGQSLLGDSTFAPITYPPVVVGLSPMNAKHVAFGYRCRLAGGCSTGSGGVTLASALTVSVSDDTRPTIVARQPPPQAWVSGGVVPLEFGAQDNVGLRRLAITVDGTNVAETLVPCYDPASNANPMPCAGANQSISASVPVSTLSDGEHVVSVSALDVGGASIVERTYLRVDREPPSAPRRLSIAGAERWRDENRFAVSWINPPGGGAPIAGAEYEFCPATNGPYDRQGCVKTSGSQDQADMISAPHDGEWSLRVALRDAAGNTDPNQAATIEPLRVDTSAPQGTFEAFDPRDPLRVRLATADPLSGIGNVEVEIRRDGEGSWRALPVEENGGTYSAFADDAQHPAGTYAVRARVTDRAGNERSITTLQDGTVLRMGLPLRSSSAMQVGKPSRKRVKSARGTRPRYERVLLERPTAEFGSHVALSGKLTDATGNARANAAIDVLERVDMPGRDWVYVATVRTGANGSFTYRAKPGPARVMRFAYRGTALTQPWSKDVELRVRAAVTIRPDRKRARNGGVVTFTGRVRSGPVPEDGKVLALQALTGRGWRTFATPRARARDGHWRHQYRFTGTTVRSRYSFRVVALSEAGYPYAQGVSTTTNVVVDP